MERGWSHKQTHPGQAGTGRCLQLAMGLSLPAWHQAGGGGQTGSQSGAQGARTRGRHRGTNCVNSSGRKLGMEETKKWADPRSREVHGMVARAGVGLGCLLPEQVRSDRLEAQEGMAVGSL